MPIPKNIPRYKVQRPELPYAASTHCWGARMQSDQVEAASGDCISFGPFRLFPTARLLEKDGRPVALGDRALDILIVLVQRTGEVVSNKELVSRVWRGLVVNPSNLRVHMNTLRNALSDSPGGTRYIANVTGQGYCFVAPVRMHLCRESPPAAVLSNNNELPPMLKRMLGSADDVSAVVADLLGKRRESTSWQRAGRPCGSKGRRHICCRPCKAHRQAPT